MLSNISKLEVVVGNKVYQLLCEVNSPLEHVKEALNQFGNFVGQIEQMAKKVETSVENKVEAIKQEDPKPEAS